MVSKRDVLALLEEMPEQLDPEDLMYRIYLLEQPEAAEADVQARRLIPHEELVRLRDLPPAE